MKARHIPNAITVFRILLVAPVVVLMAQQRFGFALALFVTAGVSDAVDGFLAKTFHWQSRLGSYLDPLADKLLLVCSYVMLGWLGFMPAWLVVLVVLRDVVIFSGALAYYFLLRPFEGQPLLISKLNTFLQLLLVFATLVHLGMHPIPDPVLNALIALVALSTLASGISYVYIWGTAYLRETRSSGT
jgi:cardiolipin synthase